MHYMFTVSHLALSFENYMLAVPSILSITNRDFKITGSTLGFSSNYYFYFPCTGCTPSVDTLQTSNVDIVLRQFHLNLQKLLFVLAKRGKMELYKDIN